MDLGSLEQARRHLTRRALGSEAAVALAVDVRPSRPADSETRALTVVGDGDETLPSPSPAHPG